MSGKSGVLSAALLAATALTATEAKPAEGQVSVQIGPGYGGYGPYPYRPFVPVIPYERLVFDPYCPGEVGVELPTPEGPVVACEAPSYGLRFGFGLGPVFGRYAYGGGFGFRGFDRFYDRGFEGHGGYGRGGNWNRGHEDRGRDFGDHREGQRGFEGNHGGFNHGGAYQPGNRDQHYTVPYQGNRGGAPQGNGPQHGFGNGGAPQGGTQHGSSGGGHPASGAPHGSGGPSHR